MTAPSFPDAARAFNRISLDAQWTADDAEAWCTTHGVTPSECIRLANLTAGRLSLMVAHMQTEGWRDGEQL